MMIRSTSVLEVLGAEFSRNKTLNYRDTMVLYNPSWVVRGAGSRDALLQQDWRWNVFDQRFSRGLLDEVGFRFVEGSLAIRATDKMRDKYRRPLRFKSKAANEWIEGYSDHFDLRAARIAASDGKTVPAAAPDPKSKRAARVGRVAR